MTYQPLLARRLRDLREAKKLSRRELSEKSGLSESLIAMMEKDRDGRTITAESAQSLAKALEVDEQFFLDPTFGTDTHAIHPVTAVLQLVVTCGDAATLSQSLKAPDIRAYASPTSDASPTVHELSDLVQVHDALCQLTVDTAHTGGAVRAYIEGRQDAEAAPATVSDQNRRLEECFDYLMQTRAGAEPKRLRLIFGLGTSPEQNLRWALWVLRLTLRYGLQSASGQFEASVVRSLTVKFPRDLWFSPVGFVDAFPRFRDEHIEAGIYVRGASKAYEPYWNVVSKSTSPDRIELFRPDMAGSVWSKLCDKAVAGDIRCVQPFFFVATRPKSDFSSPKEKLKHRASQPLSAWLRRQLAARNIAPESVSIHKHAQELNEVQQVAEELERFSNHFVDHCEHAAFIQICDYDCISEWARTGVRLDVTRSPYLDTPSERLARIDQLIDFCTRYETFIVIFDDLAALPHLSRPLDTAPRSRRFLSWLTNAAHRLVLMSSVTTLPDKKERDRLALYDQAGEGVTVFAPVRDLAERFNTAFDEHIYGAQPLDADAKRKRLDEWRKTAIARLRELRKSVPGTF